MARDGGTGRKVLKGATIRKMLRNSDLGEQLLDKIENIFDLPLSSQCSEVCVILVIKPRPSAASSSSTPALNLPLQPEVENFLCFYFWPNCDCAWVLAFHSVITLAVLGMVQNHQKGFMQGKHLICSIISLWPPKIENI